MEKAKLREQMRERLRALRENREDHKEKSNSLSQNVVQYLRDQRGVWAGFVPMISEPSILLAIDNSTHIDWVYPRVVDQDLKFYKSQDRASFVKNALGVLEPQGDEPVVDVPSIDGFLVPGVAFGRDGARLGRGKGYYDRTLKQSSAHKVGVCYSLQLFNQGHIPMDMGDVFLDLMITDEGAQVCASSFEER